MTSCLAWFDHKNGTLSQTGRVYRVKPVAVRNLRTLFILTKCTLASRVRAGPPITVVEDPRVVDILPPAMTSPGAPKTPTSSVPKVPQGRMALNGCRECVTECPERVLTPRRNSASLPLGLIHRVYVIWTVHA